MTAPTAAPAVRPTPARREPRRGDLSRTWWHATLRSGWLPAGLTALATAPALDFYGVPLRVTAVFAAYVVLGVVVPGTLVWRALHRGHGPFVADVAAGTALGYGVEVLTYIPARAVGIPLLVLAWPVGAVVTFLAVPRLRRWWRSASGAERPPVLWSWTITGTVGLLVFWSFKFFRLAGLRWPAYSTPENDSPFHLALVGEAKHHMPMTTPWLHGEPFYYHWFVYAEMAATSWVTGIEPQVLLVRLSPLPMIAGFVVLVAVLAHKLFGRWWTGPAAVVGTFFVLAPALYGWRPSQVSDYYAFSPFEDGSWLRLQMWTSPTQTFGALLFVPVVIVLVDLFRARGRDLRTWTLFGVMLCAVMGAKATFLPLLLAGLLVVTGVHLLVWHRIHRAAAIAAGVTLSCLLFAQVVLYGGTSQGLGWHPLSTMETTDTVDKTGFVDDPRLWRLGLVALVTVWCWVCVWSGVAGLVWRRRVLAPEMLLLLGMGAAGFGAVLLLGQSGGSQGYFLQSARPYLTLAAVGGLATLLGDRRSSRRRAAALVAAVAAGVLVATVLRLLDGTGSPSMIRSGGPTGVAVALGWPYLASAGAVVVVVGVVWFVRRTAGTSRRIALALVVCLLAGLGLATAYGNVARMVSESSARGWRDVLTGDPVLTAGTQEAGRWLRDHSSPDDLVATNAHCLVRAAEDCANLHFSVAAFTERRMLVEGWGSTTTAHVRAEALGVRVNYVPYWKPDVLAANDAAFVHPSLETLAVLREQYKVKWLFADETQRGYSPRLADFAELRYHSGDCAVYEL